jgi:hypothetical protein
MYQATMALWLARMLSVASQVCCCVTMSSGFNCELCSAAIQDGMAAAVAAFAFVTPATCHRLLIDASEMILE